MKKVLSIFIVLCSLLTLCCPMAFAADTAVSLTMQLDNSMMTINGTEKEIDPGRDTVPVIINGRTMVPIRAIVEEMGGTVAWEESTKTATLMYKSNEIRLVIDDTTAYFNDEAYLLDAAPTTINDRTLLPIRFIAERFQFVVDWDQSQQMITITKNVQNITPSVDTAVTPQPEEAIEASESNAVVVYFSATGTTKLLAEKIAETTGADLYEIVPEEPYTSEDLNYNNDNCRANQEITANIQPAIELMDIDLAQYDVVMLGYPIWWGQCPPPVQTFLAEYDLSNKTIAPFCTSGSSGISGSLAAIRQSCLNSTVTEGMRGTAATTSEQINAWLEDNQ